MNAPPLHIKTNDWMPKDGGTVIWVDILLGQSKKWTPLFTYSSLKTARETRDHFKGIKLLPGYHLWVSAPLRDARVRVVTVTSEIDNS